MKHLVNVADRCYFGLLQNMKSRMMSRLVKFSFYKTLIRPVLTRACENRPPVKILPKVI